MLSLGTLLAMPLARFGSNSRRSLTLIPDNPGFSPLGYSIINDYYFFGGVRQVQQLPPLSSRYGLPILTAVAQSTCLGLAITRSSLALLPRIFSSGTMPEQVS